MGVPSDKPMTDSKQRVIELAEDLFAGVITYAQFSAAIPNEAYEDTETDELVDLIRHEPHVGFLLGVSKAQGQKNRVDILQRMERLRQRHD